MSSHRLADDRSLALHRHIAERIAAKMVVRAAARIDRWSAGGTMHPTWADAWRRWLALPVEQLRERLVDGGELATAMRQSSPFAGEIDAQTRWRIIRESRQSARDGGRDETTP